MYEVEKYEHAGVPVLIILDEDPENPYKSWDQASEILSDVKDYADLGGDVPHPGSWYREEPSSAVIQRYLTMFGGYAVAIPWTFQDYGSGGARTWIHNPDDDPADGWLVMTTEAADEFKTIEDAEKRARGEFESFRAWIEGDVFGFIVADGRDDEDSCWGFYGDIAYVKEAANESAEWIAGERARLRALPWMGSLHPVAS